MNIVNEVPPRFPDYSYVAIDTEFRKMDIKRMHRPHGEFSLLTVCAEPGTVYHIDTPALIQPTLDRLDNTVWLMHHAKFDITQLRKYATIPPRRKIIDTMLMEKLLWSGWYEHFDLQSLVRRYLNEYLDKSLQESWETAEFMTPEMLEYGCKDADATRRVWNEQKKFVTQDEMRVWHTIDLPALWAVMDFQGFRVDRDRWIELSIKHRQLSDEIDERLPVNPRSPKQVVEYLREHGFTNLKSSAEADIVAALDKYPNTESAKIAIDILDGRGYRKLSSTYGANVIEDYAEETDEGVLLFGDFNIYGAATGRMSCNSPNLQNIPVREHPEFRECFIARNGQKLIICDYSQQEIFIMAYLSQDKNMMEICNSGRDIYIAMAKMIYGKEIEKGDPLRKVMKSIVLGTDYGMSKYGLSKRIGCSTIEAEEKINDFFNTFPGVHSWMKKQEKLSSFTTTVVGRKCWLNPYSDKSIRNSYNNPIQGTAAEMMKAAFGSLHVTWPKVSSYRYPVCAVVHDEMILDVPNDIAEESASFVRSTMEAEANRMLPGMNCRADVIISDNWRKE